MRLRVTCSVEEGLLYLLEVTGQLYLHLLALDMIPTAAVIVFCIVHMPSEAMKIPNTRLLSAISFYNQSHTMRKESPVMPLKRIRYVKELAVAEWTNYLKMGYPGEKVVLDGAPVSPQRAKNRYCTL